MDDMHEMHPNKGITRNCLHRLQNQQLAEPKTFVGKPIDAITAARGFCWDGFYCKYMTHPKRILKKIFNEYNEFGIDHIIIIGYNNNYITII